jgi:hypothetical protein
MWLIKSEAASLLAHWMRGVWWIFKKLSATMKQQFLPFSYPRCGTFMPSTAP